MILTSLHPSRYPHEYILKHTYIFEFYSEICSFLKYTFSSEKIAIYFDIWNILKIHFHESCSWVWFSLLCIHPAIPMNIFLNIFIFTNFTNMQFLEIYLQFWKYFLQYTLTSDIYLKIMFMSCSWVWFSLLCIYPAIPMNIFLSLSYHSEIYFLKYQTSS